MRPVFIGNRYELVDKIGQGGMGIVYHAYDRLTREDVALKQVLVSTDDLAFNSASQNNDVNLSIAGEF